MSTPKIAVLRISLAVILHPFTGNAQRESTENVLALTFLLPGISYEMKAGKYQTVYVSAFMNISGYFSAGSSLGTEAKIYLDPALSVGYRHYYNFKKRLAKNARTEKNSANFIALEAGSYLSRNRMSSSYFEEDTRRPVNHVAFVWGMQRNMARRLNFHFSAGGGFRWTRSTYLPEAGGKGKETYGKFILPINLGIGLWLGKAEAKKANHKP